MPPGTVPSSSWTSKKASTSDLMFSYLQAATVMRSCHQQQHSGRLTGPGWLQFPQSTGQQAGSHSDALSAAEGKHLDVSLTAPLEQYAEQASAGNEQLPTVRSTQGTLDSCWPPLSRGVQASSGQKSWHQPTAHMSLSAWAGLPRH